jgi:hypothetical protein
MEKPRMSAQSHPSHARKHPYHPPQLKIYGDIKTLTLALTDQDVNIDSSAPAGINKTV